MPEDRAEADEIERRKAAREEKGDAGDRRIREYILLAINESGGSATIRQIATLYDLPYNTATNWAKRMEAEGVVTARKKVVQGKMCVVYSLVEEIEEHRQQCLSE